MQVPTYDVVAVGQSLGLVQFVASTVPLKALISKPSLISEEVCPSLICSRCTNCHSHSLGTQHLSEAHPQLWTLRFCLYVCEYVYVNVCMRASGFLCAFGLCCVYACARVYVCVCERALGCTNGCTRLHSAARDVHMCS